jgi:signal transduction histidine kinase
MPQGLPPVLGDRVQIQQVLVNLAMNAIQALRGHDDGRVVIDATAADARHVAITVKDNGPGMSPAAIDRVFTPFFTTKPEGMGIGLSICRSLIEAQGGTIAADGNAPCGARFTFTLPCAAAVP